ncbi:hypothetical protein Pcinc_023328 [Petrolisthes cinctipes]|uniref:Uncharacterized protein n=1 Tax=Petrolisthes cinctipes TaxID=88211 RepID=A0AAE1FDS8_PETCI|nr:hypothetical protein Pcinc_023328 [Petrolisthes cinctipes]
MRSPTGSHVLHAAAFKGSAQIVKILLEKVKGTPPGVDVTDNDGFTPLMVAALKGHTDVVKELLGYGADLNARTSTIGYTALHFASDSLSCRGVVTALLEHGANVNARTKDSATPLHYAAEYNNLPLVKVLLSHPGCDATLTNGEGKTPAEVARRNHYNNIAQYLDLATSTPTGPNMELTVAILNNNHCKVKQSLADGADVNMCSLTGTRPLHVAARIGSLLLVQLLLNTPKVRMDPEDDEGYTPLMVAALNGHSDVVKELLIYRADPTRTRRNGETALHLASKCTSKGVAVALLDYGADINAKTYDSKMTPLHYAAEFDNHQLAVILKEDALCHPNEKDIKGRTPGQVALEYGNHDLARLLGVPVPTSDLKRPRSLPQPVRRTRKTLQMKLKVVTGIPVSITEDVYYRDPSRTSRGHVLVINYANFKKLSYHREGSEQDVVNLENLFTQMGYTVVCHVDLTLKETLKSLDEFCSNDNLKKVDAAVVCFLSHGENENTFYTSDDKTMTVTQVQEKFIDSKCPKLKGKPKLFLFNFCRGNKIEKGYLFDKTSYDAKSMGKGTPLKEKRNKVQENLHDFYIMYATMNNIMALRNKKRGTFFIQYLTQLLAQYAHRKHVQELSTLLYNRMVSRAITTPDLRNGLGKKFYL